MFSTGTGGDLQTNLVRRVGVLEQNNQGVYVRESLTFPQRTHISVVAQTLRTLQTEVGRWAVPTSDGSKVARGGFRATWRTPSCLWASSFYCVCRPNRLECYGRCCEKTDFRGKARGLTNTALALSPQMRKCNMGGLGDLRLIQCMKNYL
jgi:hypothetical protein